MLSAERTDKSADETVPDENPRVNHLHHAHSHVSITSGNVNDYGRQFPSHRSHSNNSHLSGGRRTLSRGSLPNNTITMRDISR